MNALNRYMDMKPRSTNLSLLPYVDTVIIKDITQKLATIRLMRQLLQQFQMSLSLFERRELHRFDAQVGETLCQIRAYKVYSLSTYQEKPFLNVIRKLSVNLIKIIYRLSIEEENYISLLKLHKSQRPEHARTPVTLAEFFDELDCIITIPVDASFIFISFFLCRYHLVDGENIPNAIDISAIADDFSFSKSMSKKLSHFYQKKLSELSCGFVFKLLAELSDSSELQAILPKLHFHSDEGRMVLPCYCVTEIIVQHMIENEATLVLVTNSTDLEKKAPLIVRGSKLHHQFELRDLDEDIDEPCMVMYGITSYDRAENLLSERIKEIILSNNAAHPQYSGAILSAYRDNPYEILIKDHHELLTSQELDIANKRMKLLIERKDQAHQWGCTLDNPSLFFLKHIYCHNTRFFSDDRHVWESIAQPSSSLIRLQTNFI